MEDYQPIGEMLLSRGRITREQLDTALNERKGRRQRLGEVLVELGFVREEDIAECLAEQFGFQFVDASQLEPDQEALQLLTPVFAFANRILPLRTTDETLECVLADPIDVPTTDTIG